MIEVNHVSKVFGTFKAVDDISFSIQTGQVVGLLGPNGAGKTTTMRMIAGFLRPTTGTVRIDGTDVTIEPVETKKKIGYMPESAPLYSDMIVADYLAYIADMQGADKTSRVKELSRICGLEQVMHKDIGDLSRGNRQRVGLAHALMGNPEILILDEPTGGLDPNQVSEVRNLIREMGKTRTVIVSTHILSEVEMLCSRVIIISGGKKVADSPTDELKTKYSQNAVISLSVAKAKDSELKNAVLALPQVAGCTLSTEGDIVKALINVNGSEEIRPALARLVCKNGWDMLSLDMQKNSLEEVFRSLTIQGDEK